jgi:hypothetical protein
MVSHFFLCSIFILSFRIRALLCGIRQQLKTLLQLPENGTAAKSYPSPVNPG